MRPISLALATGLVAALVQGCDGEGGPEPYDCDGPTSVAVTGLEALTNLQVVRTTSSRFDVIGVAEYPATPSREVPVDEYFLSVVTSNVVAEAPRRDGVSVLGWFVGSAKASCAPPSVMVSQRLADIDVVSDAALSDEIPAGTSLKAVAELYLHPTPFAFQVIGSGAGRNDAIVPVDADLPSVDEFVASEPTAPLIFDLILSAKVDEVREHRFTVTYSLDNGDVFTATSEPVTLSPVD